MSILTPRVQWMPFEYPQAYAYWQLQEQSHWLPSEINLSGDIKDWKSVLTDSEKNVVGHILKGFSQMEIFVGDYWSNVVTRAFKKPEIQAMAAAFANMETIHTVSYSNLNTSLNLDDFGAFLHEKTARAKIDRLMAIKPSKDKIDIARSLAIFSAFTEGVNLFSSFAVLLNFSRFNKLKGVGQIIAFSIKDESLHSEAGCWLYRTLISEFTEILTDDFKNDIYDAARLTVELEDNFIDKAFEQGEIEGLSATDLKAYIRFRTNTKLNDLGLHKLWKNISKQSIENMEWFSVLSVGNYHTDFFAQRSDSYAKGTTDFSTIWD